MSTGRTPTGAPASLPPAAGSDPPAPAGAERLPFRLDIQGLRAVAVLLVVVHHLGGLGLPGGYVGVDVFLVVSGYLITGLLLRDVETTGRVSLRDFYARRARRILPAATVVVVATVVLSAVLLPLVRTQQIVQDAGWSAVFAANIRFASLGTDYFARSEPPSPLQHYWSLAVEEQFYLVWPVLVLVVAAVLRRRAANRAGPGRPGAVTRALGVLLLLVVGVSLAWSVTATAESPTTAYFSTFARAWELAAGAGCALLLQRGPPPRWRGLREVLSVAGLAAIAVAALVYTPQTPFPGLAAVLPVAGTVLLLLTGGAREDRTATERVLGLRPLVLVGGWSFSIYLWHWPVIVLAKGALPGPWGLTTRAALLVLVVVLSWATYRWVETPFRRGLRWRPVRPALAIYPVSLALVAVVAGSTGLVVDQRLKNGGGGAPISAGDYEQSERRADPYVGLVQASAIAAEEGHAVPADLRPGLVGLRDAVAPLGACDYRTGTRELCPTGDADAQRTVVLIGDSYARALSPAIDQLGRDEGYRVYSLVYSGCMATGLVQIERDTGAPWQDCEDFKEWALDTIGSLSPDLVVVATHAGQLVDPETGETVGGGVPREEYLGVLGEGYRRLFASLQPLADRVAVVGDTPRLPREPGVCLTQRGVDLGDCAFAPQPQARGDARVLLEAGDESGATVVDATRWFCFRRTCPSVVGPYVAMRDKEHMTPDYARFIAAPLAAELGLAPEVPEDAPTPVG